MNKYLFENKEIKKFIDCSDEEKLIIVNNIEYLEVWNGTSLNSDSAWAPKQADSTIRIHAVYRVLPPKPVPNKIDWIKVPPEYRYSYTTHHGDGVLTTHLPVEVNLDRVGNFLVKPGVGEFLWISEGDYGFSLGTVDPIDSLLIRQIEE